MKQLTVGYNPYRWINLKRKARGSHPECWNEITSRQLIAVACTYKGKITDIGFLHVMTGLKKKVLKKLDIYHRYKLMELMNFMDDLKPFNAFILDKLKIDNQYFYSPKSQLKAMTFGQFIFVDSFFNNYQQNNNKAELNNFMAALYLPAGRKFNEELIEQNSTLMSRVGAVTREAAVINYLLIKQWLTVKYPLLFIKADNSENRENKKTPRHDAMSWVKIFENLVGEDLINQDKYAGIPVHNVFRFMTAKVKDNMKKNK
jgi:hypothetical protein